MHEPGLPDLDRDRPLLLFAYGTLGPSDPDAVDREGWEADAVRGRLYDLGAYPVLIDWEDSAADWVEGYVRQVDPIELVERLDPYEGISENLFRRRSVRTRSGREAWIYVYPHPIPKHAVGPLPRWAGRGLAGGVPEVRD